MSSVSAGDRQEDTRPGNVAPITFDNHFDDIDELELAADGLDQSYTQLSSGRLHARLSFAMLPDLLVGHERANQRINERVQIVDGYLLIGESGPCGPSARFMGQPIGPHTVVTLPANEELWFSSSRGLDITYALIEMAAFSELTSRLAHRDLVHEHDAVHVLAANPRSSKAFGERQRDLVSCMVRDPRSFAAPATQRTVLCDFVTELLALVEADCEPPRSPPPSLARRRRIVRSVEDFVAAYPDEPLTTADLCRMAHASARTIEYAFRYCYDMSPAAYLKVSRLNAARRALRAPDNANRLVRDIANQMGFWHMGHFGRAYKRMFSEAPSETMRRTRQAAAVDGCLAE